MFLYCVCDVHNRLYALIFVVGSIAIITVIHALQERLLLFYFNYNCEFSIWGAKCLGK